MAFGAHKLKPRLSTYKYKILQGTISQVEEQLNKYSEQKVLSKIITITNVNNDITLVLKIKV
jgi:hypothetical protein